MPQAQKVVHVPLDDCPYDITIATGLLDDAGNALRSVSDARRVGIVTDTTIAPLYLNRLITSVKTAGFDPAVAILPAGEQNKTLPTLLPVYDTFLSAKFERSTPLIALGGGVVGDMTGFVAATLLRGVPFVQIPTTLLAMVDASVGGKTGVDHPAGKNLIGSFHQPAAVLIDPAVLRTLPPRQLHSGLAECIKHEIIRDADGFCALEAHISRALSLDLDYLTDLIAHNVAIKAKVVVADPFEHGERAHLNLGHTFGHAIETVSDYTYTHGESIALGMCCAAYVAVQLQLLSVTDQQRIIRLIRSANLPASGLTLDLDLVLESMFFDKKVQSGRVRIVLPGPLGHAVIRSDIPRDLLRAALASVTASPPHVR
jgi:3-dehydroquinate synthase